MNSPGGDAIRRACVALTAGEPIHASAILQTEYPFRAVTRISRQYTTSEAMEVFLRDGFIDRYSGTRLVFPGTLRLLGHLLPDALPMHPNWKLSETHIAFWELFPTVDHVIPVARGGADEPSNWITTSMLKNQAKAHWTLEELGWRLRQAGSLTEWDGLTTWFLKYTEANPEVLEGRTYLQRWKRTAERALSIPRMSRRSALDGTGE